MLRLRRGVLAQLLSNPFASPVSHLHRLLSVTAPAISPNPSFAMEEYLVSTCGLTRPQALKASTKLSHLKSPAKPDAVLAFLAGLGLSGADVPASVEGTLASPGSPASAYRVPKSRASPRSPSTDSAKKLSVSKLLLGSSDTLFRVMKGCNVLSYNLERVIKPNLALLQVQGLGDCDIAKLCISTPRLLTANPERVQAIVTCAENIGVPRGSGMFRHALHAVAFHSKEEIAARVEYLRKTFRWTDAEVGMAVSKFPPVLNRSKESLQRRFEFLVSEVGLEPAYIAHRPIMLGLSLEGRLRPWYYAVKFLKENGLLKRDSSYGTVFKETEKVFREKFICSHKEAAPHLEED